MKMFTKLRNLTKKVSKKALVAVALTGAVIGLSATAATVAEFYPNRPTYDYNNMEQRKGSLNGPVFNSFINTPSYGDERPFLDARRSDQTPNGGYKNVLDNVTDGSKEVVLRLYIHNNANQSTNASGLGIARDSKVRISLPTAEASSLRARGYITASNAATVEDTVDFVDGKAFRVEYIPGSATLYNNGPFAGGVKLADSIVTSGAPIGYDALNGNLPGCFDYAAVVNIRVKVIPKETPSISLNKQVRKKGDINWHKEVTTKPGDTVEWRLVTQNTGPTVLNNIVSRDVLPPHMKLESGSVKFTTVSASTVQTDKPLFDGGINVGNFASGGGFHMTFSTKVEGDFDPCEIRVRNQGFAKSDQTPEIKDTADVIIVRENCQPNKPEYRCDLLDVSSLGDRNFRFNVKYTEKNAKLKLVTYDFGDKSSPMVTDKTTVDHKYTQDGTFTARATLTFTVDGKDQTVTSDACTATISTSTPKDNCPIPGKENLPKDSPDCATPVVPTELPNTGAGDVAAIFAAVSVAGMAAYRVFVTRRLNG